LEKKMVHSITFGTDGWRAVIADQFTFANVERVAYAAGLYAKETYYQGNELPPMLIGYDTRFLADKFAERTAQVLLGMGIPVRMADRDVPTPVIAFACQVGATAGALQLTASHNPPEYCGIKYIPHFAGPATNEITAKIAGYLESIPSGYEAKPQAVPRFDPRPAYFEAISKRIDWALVKKSGLKVACDLLYSTSRDYLDRLLIEMGGLKVKQLHNWRDTLFGGGMPEPKAEHLQELIKTVVSEGWDVGIATDGDADRFGVVDEKGTYFSPNQLLCLLTRHLVKNHKLKGVVVRTVATSHLLDRLAKMYGLELVETPVGFKYIGEQMRLKDVLIGGEESGGVSFKGHIPEKDGILANLKLIEMMAAEGKPLSVIWADLLKEAGSEFVGRRRDLDLTPMTQRGLMETLTKSPFDKIGSHKVARLGTSDGVKFYVDDDSWVLVRPSGTEPLIRLYFESSSAKKADDLLESFCRQVEGIVEELNRKYAGANPKAAGVS
jgi:phosphomannomutase